MASVAHLLNRTLTVMREVLTADGMGGQSLVYVAVGTVRARVSRSTGLERVTAEREGAQVFEDIYVVPEDDGNVRRSDFLTDGADSHWEVLAVVQPSDYAYAKATCRRDVPPWPLPIA